GPAPREQGEDPPPGQQHRRLTRPMTRRRGRPTSRPGDPHDSGAPYTAEKAEVTVTTETTHQPLPRRSESGMQTRAINAAAGVLQAAMEQGRQTPTGLAIALDSARLLNSPEHAAETVRLEKAAVEARAALGSLCHDREDPGTAALGALHMLTQATVWTETGPDFAADALAQHDAKVLHEAQDRVAELEAELAEYERPADEDPIAYALTEHAEVLADRYRAEVLAEVTTW